MNKQHASGSIVNYGTKRLLMAFVLLQMLTLAITSFFILRPFMKTTANTIASQLYQLVENNSETLSPKTLSATIDNTKNLANFELYSTNSEDYKSTYKTLPILFFIQSELGKYIGGDVQLVEIESAEDFYWFHITDKNIRVGFNKKLIGTKPELTMFLLLAFLLTISISISYYISRKLNLPLVLLREMTRKISHGDVTARLPKQALTELNDAFEQVNQLAYQFEHLLEQKVIFLSGISHDIRTPITRLKLLIAIHEDNLNQDFKKKSSKALKEIETLINLYLDTSENLSHNDIQLTSINSLLKNTINDLTAEEQDLIHLDEVPELPVLVNQSALKRVVSNLISNSLKYANPTDNNKIKIELEKSNQSLYIKVVDNGKGIPEEELEEAFKPFFRSSNHSDRVEGNGLGLSICRQICLSQGWQLTLSNTTDGFIATITLPYEFELVK